MKHTDAQGKPVGVSSRPAEDWQDGRQNTYGLLPRVKGFTQVRRAAGPQGPGRAPVVEESPAQRLPFDKAYLVGLRGNGTAAGLATQTDVKTVDYEGIVDFLF
ncbi:hypothetical protein AB4Z54_72480, partial [Streptomyces sp. MCAF7]